MSNRPLTYILTVVALHRLKKHTGYQSYWCEFGVLSGWFAIQGGLSHTLYKLFQKLKFSVQVDEFQMLLVATGYFGSKDLVYTLITYLLPVAGSDLGATNCNKLQQVATQCNIWQRVATNGNRWQQGQLKFSIYTSKSWLLPVAATSEGLRFQYTLQKSACCLLLPVTGGQHFRYALKNPACCLLLL